MGMSSSSAFSETQFLHSNPDRTISYIFLLGENISIGLNTYIGDGTVIHDNVRIGNCVHIGENVKIGENTIIDDGAFIGDCTVILAASMKIGSTVKNDCFLCPGSIVDAGVEIGENATVFRKQRVDKNIPAGSYV